SHDDYRARAHELAGHVHSLVQQAARIISQVEHDSVDVRIEGRLQRALEVVGRTVAELGQLDVGDVRVGQDVGGDGPDRHSLAPHGHVDRQLGVEMLHGKGDG